VKGAESIGNKKKRGYMRVAGGSVPAGGGGKEKEAGREKTRNGAGLLETNVANSGEVNEFHVNVKKKGEQGAT